MTTETIFEHTICGHFSVQIEKRSDGKFSVISTHGGKSSHQAQTDTEEKARIYCDGLTDGYKLRGSHAEQDGGKIPFSEMPIGQI